MMQRTRTPLVILLVVVLMTTAPVFGRWHLATYPAPGKAVGVDLVRVAHTDRHTHCDFLIHDKLDSRLVSLGAPPAACLPSRDF
jgi:hypothetical protein